jgi:stalled ribosome rescue protein Dom34
MSYFHAAVWIDHHSAQVLKFDADGIDSRTIKSHPHDTPQHGSAVRTEHEFFGDVCDALAGIEAVLVTGSHTAISDFRHYVDKHRAPLATHVTGYEVVDKLTDNQVVALARKHFVKPAPKLAAAP